ncbi:hypothetical protein K1T71_011162 [Dendrolimus kikuchii]|uniref:Uncharacterized protein n=1 Tax=Dendrolimus kikuchii TaxID=765133 RepID=A0ACC1CNG2_9NEOP|nr:hypothetical protein K1T71_011162 [Dendrolimus kikuchii]
MARGRTLAAMLAFSILANAFCLPASSRLKRGDDNHMNSSVNKINFQKEKTSTTSSTPDPFDDDDDDNFGDSMHTASTSGGGSNLFSLLNLAGALFPGSSGTNVSKYSFCLQLHIFFIHKLFMIIFELCFRNDNNDANGDSVEVFNSDEDSEPKPNSESKEESGSEQDMSNEKDDVTDDSNGDDDDDNNSDDDANDDDDVKGGDGDANGDDDDNNKNADNENSDYDLDDEPPEGDGQGGGLLGLLAGLSGESDLGTLLSTVGGILASLSGGDDFDLNGVIGSGIGLLAGLLSQGEENPGSVLAGYLLTSLDTITEGGAKNNGAFFGSFLSKLIKGTSMGAEEDDDDEEKEPTTDSAGFILSFIIDLTSVSTIPRQRFSACVAYLDPQDGNIESSSPIRYKHSRPSFYVIY